MSSGLDVVIRGSRVSEALKTIAGKVLTRERISPEEGLLMYREAPVAFLGMLANHIREERHGDRTYFNRNFHIEPTNVCVFSCKFCSYSRLYAHREDGWELSIDQMVDKVKEYDGKPVTEGETPAAKSTDRGMLGRILGDW